jgi:hypothetical protein
MLTMKYHAIKRRSSIQHVSSFLKAAATTRSRAIVHHFDVLYIGTDICEWWAAGEKKSVLADFRAGRVSGERNLSWQISGRAGVMKHDDQI